jgi:hypothetical protein
VTGELILQIAAQVLVFALVGHATGELILRWAGLLPRGSDRATFRLVWVGITERALTAIVGFVAFSVAMMVLHIASLGSVFSTPGAVIVAGVAVLVVWWRGRLPLPRPRPISYAKLAALLAALAIVYATPAFVAGSSVRTGDPPWHLGWTEQILAGEQLPVGPAPEFARNAYPWGLHAVMASLVELVPGSDPLVALETLHLILIAAFPIAAACLAFRLRPDAGWAAAAAVSLIGGFGWIVSSRADFITSPRAARYGADLVVASPNSVYEQLPPAFPRELGVVLLAAAGLFALISARTRMRRVELLAGFCAGLAGLISVPMFVSSLVWMLAASLTITEDRKRYLKHCVGGALLVFALWGLPVFIDYLRLEGFVNITPRLGMEWPLPVALASWGLLLPLATAGVWSAVRRKEIEDRVLLAFALGTAVVLMLAILRGRFDWDLWGNATLLHQGRVWPPLHLLGGVFGGAALMWIYEKIRNRVLATGTVVAVLGIGAISPIYASIHLTDIMERGKAGFVYGRPDVQDEGSFLRRAAALMDPDDVVFVDGPPPLAFQLFEFSGVRLAEYDNPNLEGNDLRIRFEAAADDWDDAMGQGGFGPSYLVLPAEGEATDGSLPPLFTGTYRGSKYALYGPLPRVNWRESSG